MKWYLPFFCFLLIHISTTLLFITQVTAQINSFKRDLLDTTEVKKNLEEVKNLITEGKLHKAEQKLDLATKIIVEKTGKENRYYADILHQKGRIFINHGAYDQAILVIQNAVELRKKIFGANHLDLASSLNNLGIAHYAKKNFPQAIEYYQGALNIRVDNLGEEHPTVISNLVNLGRSYHDNGQYDKAIEVYQRAKVIREKTLGFEHTDVADSYNNLSDCYEHIGEYEKAIELEHIAMTIRLKILGPNHLDVASSYNSLGFYYDRNGEYNKTIAYYQKALEIRTSQLGNNHLDVASTFHNLGLSYFSLGKYDESIMFTMKGLDIRLKALGNDHPDVAHSYNNLGISYQSKGQYDKAIEFYQKVLDIEYIIYKEGHPEVARTLNNLGNSYSSKNEYDKAIVFLKEALAIRIKAFGSEHPDIASSNNGLGWSYYNLGEYDRAIEFFQKGLSIIIKALGEEHPDVAYSYDGLGNSFNSKGEYDRSFQFHERAMAIRIKALGSEHPDVAISFSNIGDIYYNKGMYNEAIEFYQNSLALRLKNFGEEHPEVAQSYYDLAYAYSAMGEYNKSVEFYQKSYSVRLKTLGESHLSMASSHDGLGGSYMSKGGIDMAIQQFEKSLAIRLKVLEKNHPDLTLSYDNLGDLYQNKGEYNRSINFYQKSLDLKLKAIGTRHPNVASTYERLGGAYNLLGEYDKAIELFQKALIIRLESLGTKHPDLAFSFSNLGDSYYYQKKYDKSIEFFQKSLSIRLEKLGEEHPDVAQCFYDLAYCYYSKNQFDEAINFFDKSLAIQIKKLGPEHPIVASSYLGLGEAYGSKREYNKALSAYINANIASKYEFQNFQKVNSISTLLNALVLSSEVLEKQYNISSDSSLLQQSLSYAQEALAASDYQSSSFTSEFSKTHWQSQYHPIYEQAIDISLLAAEVNHNDTLLRETFTYAEKSKATQLQAQLKNADALAFSGIPDSLIQKEYQLRIDISWREKQRQALLDKGKTETDSTVLRLGGIVFDLRQQYDSLKTRFEKNYPAYYRLKYDLSTVPLQYVQDSLLQPGQTLLEYFVGDSSIYIFLVQPKNYEVIEVKKDSAFEQWVEDLTRNGIYGFYGKKDITKGKSINNYGTFAHQLYQTLIAPVKAKLGEKLIIIPDGILGYVPFEALLTEKPPRPDAISAYKYLIQDHQISYCYSATLLKEMRNKKHRQEPTQKLLAMAPFFLGNADTLLSKVDSTELLADVALRDTLTALPNSGTEVASVSKMLKGQAFYGKEATLQKFQDLASRYRILHLSTHGKADDRLGDYAYLAFGMPNAHGTFDKLYARDLYNLSLNADLVVLSACETGLGKLQRGEGIVSLARAFAYAGAKSIVTTLWKVSDEQSKNLMTSFYKYLSKGKEKDEALRQAKLDFLQRNEKKTELLHPFFWASFIGIGDMESMK